MASEGEASIPVMPCFTISGFSPTSVAIPGFPQPSLLAAKGLILRRALYISGQYPRKDTFSWRPSFLESSFSSFYQDTISQAFRTIMQESHRIFTYRCPELVTQRGASYRPRHRAQARAVLFFAWLFSLTRGALQKKEDFLK